MAQDKDRIAGAVATCLTYALAVEHPLHEADNLAPLLQGAGWTGAEIDEIQTRVRSCLMRRRSSDIRTGSEQAADKILAVQAGPPPGVGERRRNQPAPPM
jgi:hypothetical protein